MAGKNKQFFLMLRATFTTEHPWKLQLSAKFSLEIRPKVPFKTTEDSERTGYFSDFIYFHVNHKHLTQNNDINASIIGFYYR